MSSCCLSCLTCKVKGVNAKILQISCGSIALHVSNIKNDPCNVDFTMSRHNIGNS